MSRSNSPLGDVLHCPVCFEMYEGRILQCPAGHAVCENCSTQMIECPQCRLKYTGTRNYVMEEVISKFKKMNVNSIKHLDGNLNPQIRSSKIESNAAPVIAAIVVPEVIVEIIPEVVESRRIRTTIADPPIQAGGTYECRMLNCNILLPICRLLNHLRGFHKNVLTSTRGDSNLEANSVFDVVCQSYRHAIQIADMGIFFVIVNVTKEGAKTNLKAWVQQAAPNIIAKSFRFKLKITIGSNLGTYTDVVFGTQYMPDVIETTKTCLDMNSKENFTRMKIDVCITKNIGARNHARTVTTQLTRVPMMRTEVVSVAGPSNSSVPGTSSARTTEIPGNVNNPGTAASRKKKSKNKKR